MTTAPDDWERIKELFSAALALPPAEREGYLRGACDGRPGDFDKIWGLVRAHSDASSSFLEHGSLRFDAPWVFRVGDRVAGRFDVTRVIARGATGEVYEVLDSRLRLRVALKALRPQLVDDEQTAERFRREALVTRDIAHDGLCRTFDLVEHRVGPGQALPEGTRIPCLTMQLLEGQSLDQYLAAHRPLTPVQAMPLLLQIAETLDVLHDRGVVHRDLKPSNVMLVDRDGELRAVLTDFGLAKPLDQSLYETQKNVPGGAPYFMAPELFRGEKPGPKSDIYAFGLLADEMVTTRPAFSADSLPSLMMAKLRGTIERPSARAEGLPKSWEHGILRCVAKDPRERFRSAMDACLALDPDRRVWGPYWPRQLARSRLWRRIAIAALLVMSAVGVLLAIPSDPAAGPRSLIIMPFENVNAGEAGNEARLAVPFDLARRLNELPGFVIYRTNDPKVADPPVAAQRAAYMLQGRIQSRPNGLRVLAELQARRTSQILWSGSYDVAPGTLLTVQEALGREVARELIQAATKARGGLASLAPLVPFFAEPTPALRDLPTRNREAFDLYVRGRTLFEGRTARDATAAETVLLEATRIDSNFAAAFALLADVQGVFMDNRTLPHDELLRRAEGYAQQAVSIDPTLPEAQLSLAAVRQMQGRWDDAEAAFRQAITLYPRFGRALRYYGGMLLQRGKVPEALDYMNQAMAIDAYDYPSQSGAGLVLFYARRPVDAAALLERLLGRVDFLNGHHILGQVYAFRAGEPGADRERYVALALREGAAISKTPGQHGWEDMFAAIAHHRAGHDEQAAASVRALEQGRAEGRIRAAFLARAYGAMGRTDDALRELAAMEQEEDRELMYLSVSPWYDSLRAEPRFRELLLRRHLLP